MAITTRTSGTVTIVKLEGKVTADRGVREFADTIRSLVADGHARIVVNCIDLPDADDAWIEEMGKAYASAHAQGGTVKIVWNLKVGWGSLAGVTKLLTIFETFDTEAAAIASFGKDKARGMA
jgi:anti-sigma B factor antagonist